MDDVEDSALGVVAKYRGFVGKGDLICDWKILSYHGYDYETNKDKDTVETDATIHLYDGADELYFGIEGAKALVASLNEAIQAYDHFNNNTDKGEEA